MTGEEDHPLASVDARNFQGVAGRRGQARVEDVDQAVGSSVVVDAVPVLGASAALLQDGAEALDQGLAGRLVDGWLGWGDPRGLARLGLVRSFRQL